MSIGFSKFFENIFGLFIALTCDMKMTVGQFMCAWRVVAWLRVTPSSVRGLYPWLRTLRVPSAERSRATWTAGETDCWSFCACL